MKFLHDNVDKFAELFRGNPDGYGQHIPEKNPVEGEKAKGESYTKREPVTHAMYLAHLHGEQSLGIFPLDSNGNVRFMAIDVDVYPLNPKAYLRTLERAGLPFVGFRSKSGGLHLYLFFSQDTPAVKAMPLIQAVRQLLGLPKDTEVFPKQKRLVGTSMGNWLNMPYFDHEQTERYAYDSDGNKLNLDEALKLCNASRVTFEELKNLMKVLPLALAPPCLQTIYMMGGADKGERNSFLFNCCVYLKARFGKDFAENLHQLNDHILNPLDYEELDRTMISSHNKQDYGYACGNVSLKQYCDKDVCNNRKFGRGSGVISNLTFGLLTQIKSQSPYYIWVVNDKQMYFYSEQELMNQTKFRELCLRKLRLVPDRLTEKAWNQKLNDALENVVVEEVEQDDDMSLDSLWVNKVGEFLSRQRAIRASQIEQGLIWFNPKNKRLCFKGAKLLEFLSGSGMFRDFTTAQHRKQINALGARQAKMRYPDTKREARIWTLSLVTLKEKGMMLDVPDAEEEGLNGEDSIEAINFVGQEKY